MGKVRKIGERFRPKATILKMKHGVPTKVAFNGEEYALIHRDYINGKKGIKNDKPLCTTSL